MATVLQRVSRIAPYFRSGRAGIVAAGVASLVAALTEPALPALMKPLLDKGFTGAGIPLWLVPVAIIGLFTLRGAAGFIAQYSLTWAANQAAQTLRLRLFDHLLRAEPSLFTRHSASSLTNMLVYEVQSSTTALVNSVLTLVRDSLTLAALLAYLLYLNWALTLVIALLFPAIGWVMRTAGARVQRLTKEGQHANDELAYVVEENVLAWRIVRLHGAGPSQAQRFEHLSNALRRLLLKNVAASATMTPLTQILAASAMSAVIVMALWQSAQGGQTVGGFVAFITAMLMTLPPIRHLADVMAPILRGLAALERSIDLVEEGINERGGTHAVARAAGRIDVDAVTLRYAAEQASALDGFTLAIAPGETVALVGPSGAGKSSLVNLLPRFIEPTAGEIRLDGVPLREWNIESLRRQFALVSQDVVLFDDSVAANVVLGAPVDEARVRAALRGANLLEFVESLPQGLFSEIGHNGSQLSGGQRQRLAIARAIYKDAPILIFDEATSALDSEAERAVQSALDGLMKGRTTLVIAHRLSTIEHADRVVAIDAGRLVEQGTHAELLARGGLYARLHALQFRTAASGDKP
ncbi:MAG: lipid A export permease/ATP-binding protein MsbA [Ideonella sp.]|nr:MAG: lipid A export permease/ATP-binding protein MsbA [Burkholderiaceae bacterium]MBE7426874.1 lipid A export permease/ATP-binding protein MsbA [Ideonella sp.]